MRAGVPSYLGMAHEPQTSSKREGLSQSADPSPAEQPRTVAANRCRHRRPTGVADHEGREVRLAMA
jgi:hypothetical protein